MLGAALAPERGPAHAYLLHGPAGTRQARRRARLRRRAALARRAPTPPTRAPACEHGSHPDLTWVAPSGAHEMLRRDVDEAVVAAAARTPFEASCRVFVLERADTMNDEAANSLLKTLEEPPSYVVLLLLTDRPSQVLPTIASRCQARALRPARRRRRSRSGCSRAAWRPTRRWRARGSRSATARRRSRSGSATAPRCAPTPRRSPARRSPAASATAPVGAAAQDRPRARPRRARERSSRRSPRSSPTCPRRSTSGASGSSASGRSAPTGAPPPARSTRRCSSSASGTATSRASPPGRPSSPTTATALPALQRGRRAGATAARCARRSSSSTTRARGSRSTWTAQLSFEALAYRLERLLSR